MLPATQEETDRVVAYMAGQAPDLKVEFVQKVYTENVIDHVHDVWDVHTDADRWWVITNPTNLYSQDQFPNMDLAVTFHVGLCLRVPRGNRPPLADLPIEPFAACYRALGEASHALREVQTVADFQSIGMRCRETLLAFVSAGAVAMPWPDDAGEPPKAADLPAWIEHICNTSFAGRTNQQRRQLFKRLFEEAWQFTNWLTHTKSSTWYDAETAFSVTESAVGLCTSQVIRFLRGVPDACPACGAHCLSPERGFHSSDPDTEWERATCETCGWVGEPTPIFDVPQPPAMSDDPPVIDKEECIVATVPLRTLKKPSQKAE